MGALLIISPLPFEQPELTAEVTVSTGKEVCVCQAGWVFDLLTAWHPFLFCFFISGFRTYLTCCRIFPAKSSTSHFCPVFWLYSKDFKLLTRQDFSEADCKYHTGGKARGKRKKNKNPFSFGSRSMGRYFLTFALQRHMNQSRWLCRMDFPQLHQQPTTSRH